MQLGEWLRPLAQGAFKRHWREQMNKADQAKADQAKAEACKEFKVGAELVHPSGRTVRITHGQLWINHPDGTKAFSNVWNWQEVLPNGVLGPVECGYGWVKAKH